MAKTMKKKAPPKPALKLSDEANALLAEISAFCSRKGMAESTFGLHAVNDGKLVKRLRNGGRILSETAGEARKYIARNQGEANA